MAASIRLSVRRCRQSCTVCALSSQDLHNYKQRWPVDMPGMLDSMRSSKVGQQHMEERPDANNVRDRCRLSLLLLLLDTGSVVCSLLMLTVRMAF